LNKYKNIDSLIITGDSKNIPNNLFSICKNLKYFEGRFDNKYFQQKDFTGLHQLETIVLYGQSNIPLAPPGWTKYQADSLYQSIKLKNHQYLVALIKCVQQVPKLKYFALHSFELQQLPNTISNLKNIETLDLSDNDLSEVDCSLIKTINLSKLNLNNNCISSPPACFDGVLVKPFQPGECK
jgi:Leucine-rich repeat (LRR) protein